MDLKGWINAKSEEHRLAQEQKRQAESDRAASETERVQAAELVHRRQAELDSVKPHLLRGRDCAALEQYFRSLLVLRGEVKSFFPDEVAADFALRKLVKSLGLGEDELNVIRQEVSYYDEFAKQQLLGGFASSADMGVISCFFCDFVNLLGAGYEFGGEVQEFFRALAGGVFKLSEGDIQSLELLCVKVASGGHWLPNEEFGVIPVPVLECYLETENGAYLVVDLSGGSQSEKYPVRYTQAAPDPSSEACRTTELWMKRIPGGTFLMGSPGCEFGHCFDERQHRVTLTRDYYIGIFPVTQRQWELVMGKNPSRYKKVGPFAPVERVSYDDICGKKRRWPEDGDVSVSATSFLGCIRGKTGLGFDLPTEAQWEYACRAGTTGGLNNGKELTPLSNLYEVAWHSGKTHPVGEKKPNAWGLFDMHGNVWEWCRDWKDSYPGDITDPVGAKWGRDRVMRGGSHITFFPTHFRSAYRARYVPGCRYCDMGFRLALPAVQ